MRFALLLCPLAGQAAVHAAAAYITQEDAEFAEDLKLQELTACPHPFRGEVHEGAANALMVKAAREQNDIKALLQSNVSAEDMLAYWTDLAVKKSLPAILAAACLLVWLACSFQFCCHCQCCRGGSHKRIVSWKFKLFVFVILMLLFLGVVYFGFFRALESAATANTGAENFLCTSSEAASVTLNGHETDPVFPGAVEVLKDLEALPNTIEEGSEFMRGIDEVVDETSELYKASLVALHTMKLLDGLHSSLTDVDCPLCYEMDQKRPPVIDAIKSSVAYKLGQARIKVTPFSDHETTRLKAEFKDASEGLIKVKDSMVAMAKGFLKADGFKDLQIKVSLIGIGILLLVSIATGSAILLVMCGFIASCRFMCHEVKPEKQQAKQDVADSASSRDETDSGLGEAQPLTGGARIALVRAVNDGKFGESFNPISKNVHQWAGRTWCWGFCFTIMTFTVGAGMSILAVPLSQTCLLMNELKQGSGLVDDLSVALGGGTNIQQLKDIVDSCIAQQGEAALMVDILRIKDDDQFTLRKKLSNSLNSTIETHFGIITNHYKAEYESPLYTAEFARLQEIFQRDLDTLVEQLANTQYSCALFDLEGMPHGCDTKDEAFNGGCLVGGSGDNYGAMQMIKKEKTCNREEFAVYLQDFYERSTVVMLKMDEEMALAQSRIQATFDYLYLTHIVKPINELSDKTDCRFIGTYYEQAIDGFCSQLTLGVSSLADSCMICGYLTLALIAIMYLLWQISRNNFNYYDELTLEEYEKIRQEDAVMRVEADRSCCWLSGNHARNSIVVPELDTAPKELKSDAVQTDLGA